LHGDLAITFLRKAAESFKLFSLIGPIYPFLPLAVYVYLVVTAG